MKGAGCNVCLQPARGAAEWQNDSISDYHRWQDRKTEVSSTEKERGRREEEGRQTESVLVLQDEEWDLTELKDLKRESQEEEKDSVQSVCCLTWRQRIKLSIASCLSTSLSVCLFFCLSVSPPVGMSSWAESKTGELFIFFLCLVC